MAIIPGVKGLNVRIIVNKRVAEEYNDPDATGNTRGPDARAVSKYIEAKNNTEFTVQCTRSARFPLLDHDLIISVQLDGKWMEGAIWHKHELSYYGVTNLVGQRYQRNNDWFQKSFRFSALNIVFKETQNPLHDEAKQDLLETGVVRVRFYRGTFTGGSELSSHDREAEKRAPREIPEKALKGRGITHSASLGREQKVASQPTIDVHYLDEPDMPALSYDFKYRSRAALIGQLIVPEFTTAPATQPNLTNMTKKQRRAYRRRQAAEANAQQVETGIKIESEALMKVEEGSIKTEEGNVETQEIPIRTNEVPIKLEVKRERDPSDDWDSGDRSEVEVVRDARPAKKKFLGIVDLTDE